MNTDRNKGLLAMVALTACLVCAGLSFFAAEETAASSDITYLEEESGNVAKIGDNEYATLAEAVAASKNGDEIVLLKDASGAGIAVKAAAKKTITIDFKGYTYTCVGPGAGSSGTENQVFHFEASNTIALKNGTVKVGEGTSGIKMLVQNYSNLTIDNMVLDGTNLQGSYTLSNNCGATAIKYTTIIAPTDGVAFDVCGYASYSKVSVTVENSIISGKIEVSSDNYTHTIVLNLESGTFTDAALSIASGFDKAVITKGSAVELPAPENYLWDSEGKLAEAVAKIGSGSSAVYYATLAEAVSESADESIIFLLKDASGAGIALWAADGKTITINFNTYTYTCNGSLVGSEGTENQVFHFESGNSVTLMNGTLTCTGESGAKFLVQKYCSLVLNSMVLDGSNLVKGGYTLSNNNGATLITATTITAPENGVAFDVCGFASYEYVSVTVTDSVINGKIEVSSDSGTHTLELTFNAGNYTNAFLSIVSGFEKAAISVASGVSINVDGAYGWNSDGKLEETAVARIVSDSSTVYYATLAEAVVASKNKETVELLMDASGEGIAVWAADAKSITIDLGGFTYTCTGSGEGSSGTKNQAFHFEKGNTIVLKNGTIQTVENAGIKMMIQSYCDLTLTDLTVDGIYIESGNYGMTYFKTGYQVVCSNNGTVTINGKTSIIAPDETNAYALVANWWVGSYGDGTQITVDTTGTIGNAIMTVDSGDDASSLSILAIVGGNVPGGVTVEGKIPLANLSYGYVASIVGTDKVTYYATLAEAVAASQTGETVALLTDASGAGIAVWADDAKSITIDFGGYKFTCTGPAVGSKGTVSQAFHFEKGNVITLKNGTVTSTGVETSGIKMLVQNYCDLTLDKMTLDGTNLESGRYTLSNNCGTVVIDGTTITASKNGIAFDVCGFASYPGVSVTVIGNSVINGKIEVSSDANDHALVLDLESGTFNDAVLVIDSGFDKATITKDADVVLPASAGYAWNSENELAVAVAKIGDDPNAVYYATLAEAVAASKTGETVDLLMDASGEGIAVWADDAKSITINFGGYIYTCTGSLVGSTGTENQVFHFEQGNTIILIGGTIGCADDIGAKFLVQNYCDLTIDGMVLDGSNLVKGGYTLSNNCGTVIVDGTTITVPTDGFAFDICGYADYKNVQVTVSNSEINGTIEVSSDDNEHHLRLFLLEGDYSNAFLSIASGFDDAYIVKSSAATVRVTDGYLWNSENELIQASAKIGDTYYATLAEAFAAAVSGDEIVLCRDTEGEGIFLAAGSKVLTVDFATYTYTCNGPGAGSSGTETQAFHFEQGNTVILKNGKITSTDVQTSNIKMLVQNYCDLTLSGMTLDGTHLGDGRYTLSNNCGTVIIDGTAITAPTDGFAFDVCGFASYPGVSVSVTGNSVISGKIEISSNANEHSLSLDLQSGDFTNASLSMADGADKVTVTKSAAVTLAAPEGYVWDSDGKLVAGFNAAFMDGETEFAAIDQIVGKTYVLPDPAPTKEGYGFVGWFDSAGGQITAEFTVVMGDDAVLYARWTFDVSFMNGDSKTVKTETTDLAYVLPDEPVREGYTFGGWFTEVGGQGDQVTDETVAALGDAKTLYAKWTFDVSFMDGDSKTVKTETTDLAYVLPDEPEREGYTFGGWFTEVGGQGDQVTDETVAALGDAATLYAMWTFGVTFMNGDTETVKTETTDLAYVLPDGPVREGYEFGGWFTEKGGLGDQITDETVAALGDAAILYAKWTFDVSFMDGDSKTVKTETVDLVYVLPDEPVREGYTFGGWFTEKGGEGVQITISTVVALGDAATLYAKWTFNVTFMDVDTKTVKTETVDLAYVLPDEPEREGYIFVGWFTKVGGQGDQVTDETVAALGDAATLYAYWAAAKIGGVYYETLADALADAVAASETRDTVEVLCDCSGAGIAIVVLEGEKSITIDFSGHTYTCIGSPVGPSGNKTQAFYFEGTGLVVFLENGAIKTTPDSGVKMMIQSNCELSLDDMVIDGTDVQSGDYGMKYFKTGYQVVRSNGGAITIHGSTSICAPEGSNSYALVANWWSDSYSGGTYVGVETSGKIDSIIMTVNNGDDETSSKTELHVFEGSVPGGVTVEGALPVANMYFDYAASIPRTDRVAYFATLEEALGCASAGETVVVKSSEDGSAVMDRDYVQYVIDNGLELAVRNQGIAVSIPSSVLADTIEGTTGDVKLDVRTADRESLTPQQQKAVEGAAAVLSLELYIGGSAVHTLGGKAVVAVDFTPGEGQDTDNLYIAFVKDNGAVKKIDCTYKDGKLFFETDHFSCYAVMYSAPITYDWYVYLIVVLAFCAVMAAIIVSISRMNTYRS